jgi:uncharacterized protein (DUF4415 family)
MTSEQMRAARARGESRSDFARVRREVRRNPTVVVEDRAIGALIARKRGRPVVGEAKEAISLRVPVSVLKRWRASGPGWQTRMVQTLGKRAP